MGFIRLRKLRKDEVLPAYSPSLRETPSDVVKDKYLAELQADFKELQNDFNLDFPVKIIQNARIHPTAGCIEDILHGKNVKCYLLQVLDMKEVVEPDVKYYQLIVTDGKSIYSLCGLKSAYNHLITKKVIKKYSIIGVNQYITGDSRVRIGKKVLYISSIFLVVCDGGQKME